MRGIAETHNPFIAHLIITSQTQNSKNSTVIALPITVSPNQSFANHNIK